MSASAEILNRKARYDRIERVADAMGRSIGVKRLRPSEQVKIQEMAPGLDGTTAVLDENPESKTFGQTLQVPRASPLVIAASVREIDGHPFPFPRGRADLDALLDLLDAEGLAAAAEGLSNLGKDEDGAQTDGDTAKN